MLEMNWTEIRQYVDRKALVLLPLGVVEEHGPHLCLGTDIYTAHLHCFFIKEKIEAKGYAVVIAPPFYWGICQSTGSFMGSFRMRKETVKAVLLDLLTSLAEFGFKNVIGINAHGDIDHNVAILETFKEASETLSIHSRYAFSQMLLPHYGLTGDEGYLCPIPPSAITVSTSAYPDVHAGDIETATMNRFYPRLTDTGQAKALQPVQLGEDKIWSWLLGGQTQQLSPDGYLGAPADFEKVDAMGNLNDIASAIMQSNIDLMLMPHSYCTPTQPTKITSQEDIDRLNGRPGLVARL